MCTNRKWITNALGQRIVVDCGHCPACKQKKANMRARRIVNESIDVQNQVDRIFVTLTYKNKYIPYIKRSDLFEFVNHSRHDLPVYRDKDVHLYFDRKYGILREKDFDAGVIKRFTHDDFESWYIHKPEEVYREDYNFLRASGDRFNSVLFGRIGVCLYDDVQRFFKRLRQNLVRANYEDHFSYFACTEYGPTTGRSHIHLCLHVKKGHFAFIKSAIVKSWLYDDMDQRLANIELATAPSSYLGSYVNSGKKLSGILLSNPFKQKHSYSQAFGFGKRSYSYGEVKKAIFRRSLRTFESFVRDGVPSTKYVSIPKYVVSRYFPKFKGFYKLANDEIYNIVEEPGDIFYYRSKLGINIDESKQIFIKLCNLKKKFKDPDYPLLYSQVWNLRASNLLEDFHWYMDDPLESYDNIEDFFSGEVCSDFVSIDNRKHFETDINSFKSIVNSTSLLEQQYFDRCKDKKAKDIGYNFDIKVT